MKESTRPNEGIETSATTDVILTYFSNFLLKNTFEILLVTNAISINIFVWSVCHAFAVRS